MITGGQGKYVRGSTDQISVSTNWFDELKAKVPAGKR